MENLRGIVERITYANEEKGFSIIKIRVKNYTELVTVVGNMASINIGTVVTVTGQWVHNAKYGRQFNAERWEETIPATVYGLEKYLGSGLIKGIGPKYAKLIVNSFREETLDIIENNPERLLDIPNIGRKRVQQIKSAWMEHKEIHALMLFLQDHGVSTAFGHRIYKVYRNESIEKIKENPYKLADDIWGIGFKTADTITEKMGLPRDLYERCRQGIFYALNKLAEDGHCYAEFDTLVSVGKEMLDVEEQKIAMTASHLIHLKDK